MTPIEEKAQDFLRRYEALCQEFGMRLKIVTDVERPNETMTITRALLQIELLPQPEDKPEV